jgi:hypothetical protein
MGGEAKSTHRKLGTVDGSPTGGLAPHLFREGVGWGEHTARRQKPGRCVVNHGSMSLADDRTPVLVVLNGDG